MKFTELPGSDDSVVSCRQWKVAKMAGLSGFWKNIFTEEGWPGASGPLEPLAKMKILVCDLEGEIYRINRI